MVSDDERVGGSPADWVAVPQPRSAGDVLDKPPAYHDLHPNTSLNFQLNRWLAWMTPEGGVALCQREAR